jgi:hypothetical protein
VINVKELRRKYCNRKEGEQLEPSEYYTKLESRQSAVTVMSTFNMFN